jgi:Flp pilus assembly protein TadG
MPLARLPRNRNRRGNAVIEFALASTVLIPMFFGTIALGLNLGRNLQVTQVSRDIAVMYSRGIDFSQAGSHAIVRTLASGLDLTDTGDAVVIPR